jgi:hypothetical protein
MKKELKDELNKISHALGESAEMTRKANKIRIRAHWQIGKLMADREKNVGKYGQYNAKVVSSVIGVSESLVGVCKKAFDKFTLTEMQKAVSWGRIQKIIYINNPEVLERAMEFAQDTNLSEHEFIENIDELKGRDDRSEAQINRLRSLKRRAVCNFIKKAIDRSMEIGISRSIVDTLDGILDMLEGDYDIYQDVA